MPPAAESPTPTCPQCGGPLDPTLPGGGCGACLWGDLILGAQEEQQQGRRGPEIPGYEIKEEIGRGGMGVVFLARQESSGREVALKMVAPDTLRELEARQRFLVEVEAMAAVQHPALIPLYDAGQDAYGRPWLAMQYAAGGTLAARLAGYSRQWRLCAELLVTLARAVAYAHERGVLHRDLKPANILFDAAGHPYVADFGLAKWADEDGSVTRTASVLGSPAYLAPEAAASGSKATTTVSDVYGLGAILYELLCGARPYEGASAPEIITRIRDHAPAAPRAKLPDIPLDLEVIVLKAMAREPGQRYASAAALADDLQRWLDGLPILARPLGPLGRLLSWSRRKPALAALSGLLAGSVITGGVMVWRESQRRAVAQAQAEERVDFMIRDLPGRLAPLGRLDLLDRVFENVAGYYREAPATDAAGLAREADFLTGWAQILRPRGQTLAAVERLRDAMDKARTAMPASTPGVVLPRL
jgi:serine/threonine protein kinase